MNKWAFGLLAIALAGALLLVVEYYQLGLIGIDCGSMQAVFVPEKTYDPNINYCENYWTESH